MQEKAGAVFVVATANDVSGLPPELLRKGRFDELFFVDLPNATERAAIVAAAMRAHGITWSADVDTAGNIAAVADETADFTGAELAALVPDAMYAAFADNERQITAADLLRAAAATVPLARTASEKIDALRAWAKGRARSASTTTAQQNPSLIRTIDL
jgi:SpoVK/Ycf46/Vps4 family AAA+-type ATPase